MTLGKSGDFFATHSSICPSGACLRWAERETTARNPVRAMPQGKQIGLPKDIPSVLAVAGVDQKRVPLPFSSQGPCFWEGVKFFSDYPKDKPLGKPDLTAFPTGYPIWNVTGSHRLRPGWKEVSKSKGASLIVGPAGNSFSGPHCAGVAALVFSANPDNQSLGSERNPEGNGEGPWAQGS